MAICYACDPIEDKSLREQYYENVGTPITKAQLQAAISVTQPIPNVDGAVEGDQYVVLKNSRPDIPGVWHIEWGPAGNRSKKTLATDAFTYICETNADYDIYFVAISENQLVQTDPIHISVTNVFDLFDNYFTGAENKADKSAGKRWEFRNSQQGYVCHMGAHGAWKYATSGITPEGPGVAWWGQTTRATAGEQTMVFEYDGNKLTTYKANGTVDKVGGFSYNHNEVEESVFGELTTTIPVSGGAYDYGGSQGTNNVFWIVTFDEDYLSIFHPEVYVGGGDWDDEGWYCFYQAKP